MEQVNTRAGRERGTAYGDDGGIGRRLSRGGSFNLQVLDVRSAEHDEAGRGGDERAMRRARGAEDSLVDVLARGDLFCGIPLAPFRSE